MTGVGGASAPASSSRPAMGEVAVAGRPRRLIPLVLGYEAVSEAMSLPGGSSFRWLLEPVTAAAIVYDRSWILIDGGFDPIRMRDPALRAASFGYENYAPVIPAGDPLIDRVAAAGLDWSELGAHCLTHTHFDHTGGVRLLSSTQPLVLQRREYEYLRDVEDERGAFVFRSDVLRPDVATLLVEGDTEVAPGLTAIDTSGHTPGHQSFVVELPEETIVLAGDAADLRANIELGRPCGSTVGADGPERAERAITRLMALDARDGTTVWPGHDPEWEPWRRAIDHTA